MLIAHLGPLGASMRTPGVRQAEKENRTAARSRRADDAMWPASASRSKRAAGGIELSNRVRAFGPTRCSRHSSMLTRFMAAEKTAVAGAARSAFDAFVEARLVRHMTGLHARALNISRARKRPVVFTRSEHSSKSAPRSSAGPSVGGNAAPSNRAFRRGV